MTTITRQAIFEQAARKLRQEFEELSATLPHAGVKGAEGERLIRRFLDDHLPKRFATGSGFIIDREENISRQTDVIVYDALNCPVYRASAEAAIIPSDNVAAVVEVKARLDKERLLQAASNIAAAKRLRKSRDPQEPDLATVGRFHSPRPNRTLPPKRSEFTLKSTYGCVFAFESAITLETMATHLREVTTGLGDHIDLIVVLDRGLICLMTKMRGSKQWGRTLFDGIGGDNVEGAHLGYGIYELGTSALDGFLRMLLSHLTFFRAVVGQSSIDWGGFGTSEIKLQYLTPITLERDPVRREQKLARYMKEFEQDVKAVESPK